MKISRRTLLKLPLVFASGGTSLLTNGFGNATAGHGQRPNVLVVLTDDQRWDTLGFVGKFPFLQTPNMDRLAAEGAYFPNAFVTTSLCSPNRATLLTGCYAHIHGVRANDINDLDSTFPTYPQLFQEAGYETAFVGKWHMAPESKPRPGFNYWLSFAGQGVYMNPALNENGREFRQQGYITDILTSATIKWLEQPRTRPFLMILSHKAMHNPFTPARRHADLYADVKLPKPKSYDDTFEGKPKWLRQIVRYGIGRSHWRYNRSRPVPDVLSPVEWDPKHQEYINYLRTLAAVDESLGSVLDVLELKGELDNTIIIYTSDNGYFLGEHRRSNKQLMYEESIRVPLLIRYPRLVRPGAVITPMVASTDIAPTLLDVAEIQIPDIVQGSSLLPLFQSRNVRWRQTLLYEYFYEWMWPGIPTILGVRTQRWKYIHTPDLPEQVDELYDLSNDPYELVNLISSAEHAEVLQTMKTALARELEALKYVPPEKTPFAAFFRDIKYIGKEIEFQIKILPKHINSLLE
jgi:N-acetylglucosamine-6-sulfatase